jgi:thiosulfate reductase cytochrome b subunit
MQSIVGMARSSGRTRKLYWRDHSSWATNGSGSPARGCLATRSGRHWHFWSVTGWVLCGLLFLVTITATSEWRRLIPTSWSILPDAWHALLKYAGFRVPEVTGAYNPLQQLIYFALVLGLAPLRL